MPYFRGGVVSDDALQGMLTAYRQQNPGAPQDDASILNVLEGRAQPNWQTQPGPWDPGMPPVALSANMATGWMPPGGPQGAPPWVPTPPGGWQQAPYQLMGSAGGGGLRPLSALGRAGGGLGGAIGGLFGFGGRRRPPGAPGSQLAAQIGFPAPSGGGMPGGGLDSWGRVPFDPTYGAPPPPGGFPPAQLMGQAGFPAPPQFLDSTGRPFYGGGFAGPLVGQLRPLSGIAAPQGASPAQLAQWRAMGMQF